MPLYLTRRRDTDATRIIEAPNNRVVLTYLAAEIFDVSLAKVETIGDEGEAEPARRRGRPPKNEEAPAVQDVEQAAKPEAAAPDSPAPADEAPAASDAADRGRNRTGG